MIDCIEFYAISAIFRHVTAEFMIEVFMIDILYQKAPNITLFNYNKNVHYCCKSPLSISIKNYSMFINTFDMKLVELGVYPERMLVDDREIHILQKSLLRGLGRCDFRYVLFLLQ